MNTDAILAALLSLVYFEYVFRPRPAAKHSSLKRFMLRIHGVGWSRCAVFTGMVKMGRPC